MPKSKKPIDPNQPQYTNWSLAEIIDRAAKAVHLNFRMSTLSSVDTGNKAELRVKIPESLNNVILVFTDEQDGLFKGKAGFVIEAIVAYIETISYLRESKEDIHPFLQAWENRRIASKAERERIDRSELKRSIDDLFMRWSSVESDQIERNELASQIRKHALHYDKNIRDNVNHYMAKISEAEETEQ